MRRLPLIAALLVSFVIVLPGCNLASRNRVQAINRMNEGIQLFDKNNSPGAEKALQDAIQLDPTYAAAYHTLGQIYKKQNKLVDAEKAFQGAIDNMKSEPNAEYYYDLGAIQSSQGEADGVASSERETKFRAAINSFQEALKLDPKVYKAHYRTGTLHEKLDEPEKADAAYRKTIEIKPSYSPAFVSLGNMYIDYGFANVAMVVLQTGAQINDKDARMWNGLGRAHFELGQFQEAIDAYSKAKAIDPDGVDALYGLGMAYAELQKRKEAKENLELFISKAGQETRPDLVKAARDTVARMADVI
ncbi:MAG TPA: tetratricopeptide repeat protein [Nannocystis sp.]|jgi:tetratricopeptide (TPR) repeat protein